MSNPGENMGLWLGILACAGVLAAWNIRHLRAVRPSLDRLVAVLGAVAIVAVVVGASLVFTEVTECAFAASSLNCGGFEMLVVAIVDLAVSAALLTQWLRSDACRSAPEREIPRTRRQRAVG